MKIKNKILFWFLVPSILIAAITATFCYVFTRKTVEQDIFNQLEIAADDLQEHVSILLNEKKGKTIDLRSDGFIRKCTEEITMKEERIAYHTSALNTYLIVNKKSLNPNISGVFVIDFGGKIIASTDEKRIGEVVSSKKCFLEATSHIGYNTEPYYDIHSNEMMIDFFTVLHSKVEREPIGIIVNQIKYEQKEDKGLNSASIPQDDDPGYYKLIAVNKARILDFSSDGFIRDCIVEITRRDKRVLYYTDLLNEHLEINKKPIDPDILAEFIVDLDGNVISSTDIDQIGKNVSNEKYFLESMRIGSHISNLHYFPKSGINTFEVARLLKGTTNEYNPIGIIVNRYNGDVIGKIIRSRILGKSGMVKQLKGMGETGEVYVVNSDKLMITGSRFIKDVVLKQLVDTEGVNTAHDNGNGMVGIYDGYRGVPVLGVSRYIEELDWVVLAEKDVSEAFAPIVHLRNMVIVMGLISVIMIAGVSIILSGGISRSVIKLTKATKRIANGDLRNTIKIGKGNDEIRELSKSFNGMMINLAKANKKNKQLFSDIKRAKDYSENLLETAQDTIISIDADGMVNVWNHMAEKTFGYSKSEIIGQPIITIIPERYKMLHLEGIKRFIKTGQTNVMDKTTTEVSGITKEGIEVPIEMSLSFQKTEDGRCSFTAIIRNVAEKRKWEEGLMKTNKKLESEIKERKAMEVELNAAKVAAEKANVAKSEFLANMSHEIRTPMNGVIGMTNLLLDTELKQEQREYTNTVRESADSLLSIINDILDFSKIEAGKLEMKNIDFDLRVTVDGIIDVFAVKTEKKDLAFSCFVDPEVPSLLRGDPGRIRQVLINFVNNAIKFTSDGEVAINVNLAEETESHATVKFDVRDTGVGIPADRMNLLFKSFSQIDSSTSRKYGGTGLGLAISKRITELMGGQIGVESREDTGSTFWFTVMLEKQSSDQQVPIDLGEIENMRVLVVGDNGTNHSILRRYLESWHCRVEEADSAVVAMKKLRDVSNGVDQFKVVLIDYCMPEVDGELLGKEIKADSQLKDLALVMLTSFGQRGDAEHLRNLGFSAFLPKPVSQSQLFDCLRIVTGKGESVEKDSTGQIVTRYSISEERKKRVRILLAEDNIVNQKVALHILDKKLGYHADVVNSGKEAIESLEKFDYDLVLMDCQMPEMDGYEATCTIRNENAAVRNHNIPIIAMTANAMKGDREKCLEVGMDDYVTKPVNIKKLSESIERNLHNPSLST